MKVEEREIPTSYKEHVLVVSKSEYEMLFGILKEALKRFAYPPVGAGPVGPNIVLPEDNVLDQISFSTNKGYAWSFKVEVEK